MYTKSGLRSCLLALLTTVFLTACAELIQPPSATPSAESQLIPATLGASTVLTPTPLSADQLFEQALQQREIGEYDAAAEAFFAFGQAYPEHAHASEAVFYLAESFFLRRQYVSAISALEQYIARAQADDPLLPRAVFLLARSAAAAGEHQPALAAFQQYRSFDTPISPYAQLLEASSLVALHRFDQAAQTYAEAAAQAMVRTEQALAFEQAATLARDHGRPAEAQQLYAEVLSRAEVPSYRAKILFEASIAATQAGNFQQQQAFLNEIMTRSPETEHGLLALDQQLKDSMPVTPTLAARIYVLHKRWDDALSQYDAALAVSSGEEQLEVRRQRALVLRTSTVPDYATALAELAAIGAASPNSNVGLQAQLDWIQTLGQSGDSMGAISAYREYAAAYPNDQRAPEALYRAGLLLERQGAWTEAAQQHYALAKSFPQSNLAADAFERAGILFMRYEQPEQALAAFQQLSKSSNSAYAARASYWLGQLAQEAGDAQTGRAMFEQTMRLAPDSYESARASEQLNIQAPGTHALGAPIEAADWVEFDQWLASWVAPMTTTLHLAQDAGVLRALMLEELWMHAEAKAEWNEQLRLWRNQPQALAQLARLAHEHGLTDIALLAALGLESLSTQPLPEAMLLLLHPTPYAELVQGEAAHYGVDPRLMYALFRQESAFDAQATSWVGARGLAQVMPETGAGLAQGLGVAPFSSDDLYRPSISVRFGTSYLAQQLRTLDGSVQGALSAYNGGLGNTYRWEEQAPLSDPDMFVEQIDFPETRNYVRRVYGFYGAYQRLYARP